MIFVVHPFEIHLITVSSKTLVLRLKIRMDMLKKYKFDDKWLFVGMLSVSLVIIVAAFSRVVPLFDSLFFNSDTLHLPYLYKDLFIDGNELKDWNLPASPNFLPDMLLYFPLMFIFSDFIVASFAFSLIQYLLILGLFAYLLKYVLPQNSKLFATISGLFMMMFLFDTFYSGDIYVTFLLFSNAYHNGAFVMTLLALMLTFRYLHSGNRINLYLILSISWLAVLSDRLFIIMFTVPFIVISLLYMYLGQRKKFKPLLLTNIIGLILGLLSFKIIIQTGYLHFAQPHKMLDLGNSIASFSTLMKQLGAYLLQFNFKSAIVLLSLISLIFIALFFVRNFYLAKEKRDNPITIYLLFTILFSGFVFFAPIINGNYSGWDTLRYNIAFFHLAILNTGLALYLLMEKWKFQIKSYTKLRMVTIALTVIALSVGISMYSHEGIKRYFAYYPKDVEKIDKIAAKHGLNLGVGHYWVAKHTTMFSKNQLVIHPVFDHIKPFYHTTNENMFYADSAVYNFVVLNRFVDTSTYKQFFGEGILLSEDDHIRIIKVEPFKFDSKSGHPYFINPR